MIKRWMRQHIVLGIILGIVALNAGPVAGQSGTGFLKKGDRIAIIGDSITEQKIYCRFIETYLLACQPQLNLHVIQLGWSGGTAAHFANRMENDLMPWKPSVATICFGMNDGLYRPYNDKIGKGFEQNSQRIVDGLKAAGARVVVGTPGIVDPRFFPPSYLKKSLKNPTDGKTYNQNLAHLRDLARELAKRNGVSFANIFDPMAATMKRLKADCGADALIAGADGIHPVDNGHLIMAYAFLKALGLSGEIGTITVDMKADSPATATEGHSILSSTPGRVELESTRYPFCFPKTNSADMKTSWSTRTMLPYLPFNQDLNRFTLRVKGLTAARAAVRWGDQSKTFTRAQLEAGINLAAEFLDNPFYAPFAEVNHAVVKKETFETFMIKQLVTQLPTLPVYLKDDAEIRRSLEDVRGVLTAEDDRLHAAVRAAIRPVRHTITVTEK